MDEDDLEWQDEEEPYASYEVRRTGDFVHLAFSKISGVTQLFELSPEDAETIGIALVQAGQEGEQ